MPRPADPVAANRPTPIAPEGADALSGVDLRSHGTGRLGIGRSATDREGGA
ncbi:protein of unassigned function [Methylobacterium oryzae CBMB20]|uniref:Protein of unassigned function n=1 Tax=Methylobacterium oryzae CBMB20 TaxID=693986 RepID=A0A089P1K9_9HYPH|nr:protein of unassigned function [Methylobacterium oryzae CBMB20]